MWRRACFETTNLTGGFEVPCEHLSELLGLANVDLGDGSIELTVKRRTLLIVEVVTIVRDDALHEVTVATRLRKRRRQSVDESHAPRGLFPG